MLLHEFNRADNKGPMLTVFGCQASEMSLWASRLLWQVAMHEGMHRPKLVQALDGKLKQGTTVCGHQVNQETHVEPVRKAQETLMHM